MTTVSTLCQAAQATPEYATAVQKYGSVCTVNDRPQLADSIADTCMRSLVTLWATCGATPAEKKRKRQQKRAMRADYAASLSQTYQLNISPQMVAMGLLGLAIAFFGGIPMLLLSIACVCFEHFFEQQILDEESIRQAAVSMGAA